MSETPVTSEPSTSRAAPPESVSVFAPATVSNVGPGFDAFGFALDTPGDVVHARRVSEPGVRIVAVEGDDGVLPREPERNTASVAAAAMIRRIPLSLETPGLELTIEKGLRGCSGLGSSAASAVAGAVAALHLAGRHETADPRVIESALDGEVVASGGRHADNVAPSLLGGFVIVQGVDPPRFARFEPALDASVAVVTPSIEISTKAAREALPPTVPLTDAVHNWANASALILGLVTGDRALVADAIVDVVVEPHRSRLIPRFDDVRDAALGAGAFACTISGSGPTLFALADTRDIAARVATSMSEVFTDAGLDSVRYVSGISHPGARRV